MIKAVTLAVIIISLTAATQAHGGSAEARPRTINLPTSKEISLPVPGFVTRTNSFPAAIAVSPDGRFAAILNQGYGTESSRLTQSIGVLDLRTNQYHDFPDPRLLGDDKSTLQSYFIGLAFSLDGSRLYASLSAASKSGIAVYRFANGVIEPERVIDVRLQSIGAEQQRTYQLEGQAARRAASYPAGIAVAPGPNGEGLLVANNLSDNAVLLDVGTGQVVRTFDLGSDSRFVPREFPYTVISDRSGKRAWVSEWNDSAVVEVNLETGRTVRRLEVRPRTAAWGPSDHPTTMLLSPNERTLYVAVSNATEAKIDGVAAFDLTSGKLVRVYRTAVSADGLAGSAPIGLALSGDGRRLFATSATQNAVAVFDVDSTPAGDVALRRPIGFIPTEWYPSALAVVGNDLLIASAKGEGAGPNNMAAAVISGGHPKRHPYIPSLMAGALQRISLHGLDARLGAYTRQVETNNLVQHRPEKIVFANGTNPIHHVIYILKENRTYDQIFGDLPAGDGDPSLLMYGAEVTPNLHRLALQFGVIDNFYDSGEVSANGHLWSDGAASSDYMEDIWPPIYRGSERPSDFGNDLEQGISDPDDPGTGFLWDNLAKHKRSFRIYGEMVATTWCRDQAVSSPREGTPSAASGPCSRVDIKRGERLPTLLADPIGPVSPWPWSVPRFKNVVPTKAAQRGRIDPNYPDFAVDYPDQLRADEFLRQFKGFVAARGSARQLPEFSLVYLPNDHTGGTRVGWPSPRASVADNDLAVGRIVEAVSKSAYWNDTAIFVLEDDAQDGADHVDAHRSIALVISKYSPRTATPFVDHRFYTTVGMVHTVETLLRLPPMNLLDARARIFAPLFTGLGNQPPYQADDRNLRNGMLFEMNKPSAPGAKESAALDFSRPDAADTRTLNVILWRDAKAPQPALSSTK